jgi:nicotinate-nucleotide pyrophosphorylase (carboxylating)
MSIKETLAQFNIPDKKLKGLQELPNSLQDQKTFALLIFSLIEDLSVNMEEEDLDSLYLSGDITSISTINKDKVLTGKITAKQDGVIAGLPVAKAIFRLVSPEIEFSPLINDGTKVSEGEIVAEVQGPGRAILTAERPALNFLGRMSGTASLTREFVDKVKNTNAVILDTRKTAPGFRKLDKYAVRMGGGKNHRMGLFDMALIKDNHIDGAGSIEAAVSGVRKKYGDQFPIEVEVKDLEELQIALRLDVERIMLDNMDMNKMKEAVVITHGRTPLEASGNVSLERIRDIAETGVDFISIGVLTHSAPAFDLSMRLL